MILSRKFYPGILLALVCLAFSLALWSGCRPSVESKDRTEWTEDHIVRAQEAVRKGRIVEATKLYKEALKSSPDLAIAHLELALLLHSYESDYIGAIYHYREYLLLTPGSEKKVVVEDRIRIASQQFAVLSAPPDNLSQKGDVSSFEKEALALRKSLQNTSDQLIRAKAETRQVRELLLTEQARTSALKNKIDSDARVTTKAEGRTETKIQTPVAAPVPRIRTYEVLRGDTLSKIALKVYKDPGRWSKILEANREVLGGSDQVQPGQILIIP
jgi:tetratricopeptide (TPR) repeat protein